MLDSELILCNTGAFGVRESEGEGALKGRGTEHHYHLLLPLTTQYTSSRPTLCTWHPPHPPSAASATRASELTMAPTAGFLAKSESKKRFFERLGLDERNKLHRQLYSSMKASSMSIRRQWESKY